MLADSIIQGSSRSCGCLQREVASATFRTHGHTLNMQKTAEYQTWASMIGRCCTPTAEGWPDYGGRGVTVCERWRDSFEAFLADMGHRPSAKHSIERLDVNGHYEPYNCVWATRATQSRNTRRNRMITFQGRTQCLIDWAVELGLTKSALKHRLDRGWSVERALSEPLQPRS